ncbi:Protein RMD5 homolog [Linum grandiflorum]
MDLNPVKDAFDRVAKRQKRSTSNTQEVLDIVVQEIETAIQTIQSESGSDCKTMLVELKKKLQGISHLGLVEGKENKELSIALNKYAKQLDRSFIPDIFKAYRNIEFDIDTLNQIVASHFYREGLFEIGDHFVNSAKEQPESLLATRAVFHEMYTILEALKARSLAPALAWVERNGSTGSTGLNLRLKLHQLQFVEILRNRSRKEALDYARTNIAPFADTHFTELQKTMACLLWFGKLDRSPYTELLSPTNWTSASSELVREFCCNILGQSFESPLSVTLSAGIQVLPSLLKFVTVMARTGAGTMKELPVPVELDGAMQFHSVFVCPVLKEQSSEGNPPMLMSCGHVLCKQSIGKMSKNHTKSFKCPYCPTDIDSTMCRPMYL